LRKKRFGLGCSAVFRILGLLFSADLGFLAVFGYILSCSGREIKDEKYNQHFKMW